MKQPIAYDTETTGLQFYLHEMFAYSTCTHDGTTTVVRMDGKAGMTPAESQRRLAAVWADKSVPIIMHNAKFDCHMTEKRLGRRLVEDHIIHDTQMLSHIVRNDHRTHALKPLAWEIAGVPVDDEKEIKKHTRNGRNYSHVPVAIMERYQHRDAMRTMLLYHYFMPKVQKNKRWAEAYRWEMDSIRATMRMEERGLMLNVPRCHRFIITLAQDAAQVQEEARTALGYPVRLGNPDDVRDLLFKRLGLPVVKLTKGGQDSADKHALAELKATNPHPILDMVLKYRSWTRGVSTMKSYLEWADENGIIRPSIHTIGAYKTGRESCANPNLQNVSKAEALLTPFPIPARKVFRPRPGFVNFHIDYAGIELRLLVHYSKDEAFVKELNSERDDPHLLAAEVFYPEWSKRELKMHGRFAEAEEGSQEWMIAQGFDPASKGTSAYKILRTSAKNANFAIPYGANADRVAGTLGVPLEIGAARYADYRAMFPRICGLNRTIQNIGQRQGFVETAFGRRLHVYHGKEYAGTNYLIQGTAAEILKRAQVRVHQYLEKATGGECGILLPIHDEIIIEWPRKRLADAAWMMREINALMTDFPMFDVPMKIEIDIAYRDWATKHKFNFTEEDA